VIEFRLRGQMEFNLEGQEFIVLQALIKAAGLCETGGAAKVAIIEGKVSVDGVVEIRRGKKIRSGQTVSFAGKTIQVK
jgi:ribosome-associated protein